MTKTPPCHWHNPQHHAPWRGGDEKKAAHLPLVFSSILIPRKRGEEKKTAHLTLVFSSILIPREGGEEKKAAHHRRRNGPDNSPCITTADRHTREKRYGGLLVYCHKDNLS